MEKVILPKTVNDLYSHFEGKSIPEILQMCKDPSKFLPSQAIIWKYCGSALAAGRPLDTAMIFMAGASGAGKSSTINVLFDDSTLCSTSSSKSETKNPVLLQKELCVTKESPSLQGNLSFVDVPGIFDTDSRNEAVNSAAILKFRKSRYELASRYELSKIVPKKYFTIPKRVYPNLVLFTVKADNRMDGPDSFLRKSLVAFKNADNLFDSKRPNIIVVLTHVLSFGCNTKRFAEQLEEQTNVIRDVILDVLKIPDVDVIPIENQPDNFNLQKQDDFYILPNGELSHHNLFQSMKKVLDRNNDLLGKLLIAWYFGSNCPDKTVEPKIIEATDKPTETEIAIEALSLLDSKVPIDEDALTPRFTFQGLGYGYCPVTEEIKPDSLRNKRDILEMKTVVIKGNKFLVPACVKDFRSTSSSFYKQSFYEKEEYQNHMKACYGIETDLKLVVTAHSDGRWIKSAKGSSSSSFITMTQEIQTATFKLDDPRSYVTSQEFHAELESLPDIYSHDTAKDFQAFFSRWGTHLIHEQSVGGTIQFNFTMQTSSMSSEKLKKIEADISTIFKKSGPGPGSGSANVDIGQARSALKAAGVTNEHFKVDGGDPPGIVSLEGLTPDQIQCWSKSVPAQPVELKRSIKLYPYYNFLKKGRNNNSLREATRDYMSNTLSEKIKIAVLANRNAISEKVVNEVVKSLGTNCFPAGTMVALTSGYSITIELHSGNHDQFRTIGMEYKKGFENKLKLGSIQSTSFCTYLDRKDDIIEEYLVLFCSNGKKLVVSEGHLIFQFLPGNNVIPKQAKHFKLGEKLIFLDANSEEYETPEIQSIHKESRVGAYSPLTTSGTFIADGFLVSSYAEINSFGAAQAAVYPLKVWEMMKKKIGRKESHNKNLKGEAQGIHPYAKFLLKVTKSFSSFTANK